jgi:hypothetical protein
MKPLDYNPNSSAAPDHLIDSFGLAVMVMPAVALLAGGSATAARTGG